jgi:hypothetical protein
MEEDLGQLLSFCVDPKRVESQGVYKRLLRAFDPRHAKNEKDRRVRERKRQRALNSILHADEIPSEGIYPGLGERWNRPKSEQIAVTIPKRYIDRLGTKIVRGIAFLKDGCFIEEGYEIEHYAVEVSRAEMFEDAIARFGHSLSRGPGIVVDRAVTQEDGISSIYKITIWGEFVIYVSVLPKELVGTISVA